MKSLLLFVPVLCGAFFLSGCANRPLPPGKVLRLETLQGQMATTYVFREVDASATSGPNQMQR